jgi:hypothetical protein
VQIVIFKKKAYTSSALYDKIKSRKATKRKQAFNNKEVIT